MTERGDEEREETVEEILDRGEREPAEMLVQMRGVWGGYLREPLTDQQRRLVKVMEDDPKGFQAQLAGLEKAHDLKLARLGPVERKVEESGADGGTERVSELMVEEWSKLEGKE